MKVQTKSSAGSKRRRKGNGQARHGNAGRLSAQGKAEPCTPIQPLSPKDLKTRPGEQERIRQLWEHKQGELEARWATAQTRQAERDTRRKRAMRTALGIAGAVLTLLLCIVAWFAA